MVISTSTTIHTHTHTLAHAVRLHEQTLERPLMHTRLICKHTQDGKGKTTTTTTHAQMYLFQTKHL